MVASAVPAVAAAPAYCALYGREYAAAKVGTPNTANAVTAFQRLQDQAYFRCLNQDEDPPFPTTSAYFGASADAIVGDPASGEGDASDDDETLADIPASPDPPRPDPVTTATIRTASDVASAGSGLKAWSPEWIKWCKQHYHSFNAKSGMVLTVSGITKLCP